MKKTIRVGVAFTIVAALCLVVGCAYTSQPYQRSSIDHILDAHNDISIQPPTVEEERRTVTKGYDIEFWTDEETGVQYIIYDRTSAKAGMGGITPRLNADGTLYVVY